MREFLDWLEDNDHHDGGAVGVGNDVSRAVECVLGIALGYNEGHIVVHAESA